MDSALAIVVTDSVNSNDDPGSRGSMPEGTPKRAFARASITPHASSAIDPSRSSRASARRSARASSRAEPEPRKRR